MTNPMDQIRVAFEAMEMKKITVPEWGNMEIWCLPRTTDEQRQLREKADKRSTEEMVAFSIVLLSRLESGDKKFKVTDAAGLMTTTPAQVLARVSTEIIQAFDDPDNADIEKN